MSHFLRDDNSTNETNDFLKNEYGTGGSSGTGCNVNWSSKGITIAKGSFSDPTAVVHLSWTDTAKRIGSLISDGEYMTQAEIDRIPAYERQQLGTEIYRFYENAHNDKNININEMEMPLTILKNRGGDF